VKRGEIWTMAGGPGYAGKPRPVLIIQDDAFDVTASITVCLITSEPIEAPILRLKVKSTPENGLLMNSHLMVDKITTVSRTRLGQRIGMLADDDLLRLNRSMIVYLGLAR
jgi:mRNA interferase MazF